MPTAHVERSMPLLVIDLPAAHAPLQAECRRRVIIGMVSGLGASVVDHMDKEGAQPCCAPSAHARPGKECTRDELIGLAITSERPSTRFAQGSEHTFSLTQHRQVDHF